MFVHTWMAFFGGSGAFFAPIRLERTPSSPFAMSDVKARDSTTCSAQASSSMVTVNASSPPAFWMRASS